MRRLKVLRQLCRIGQGSSTQAVAMDKRGDLPFVSHDGEFQAIRQQFKR